MNLRYSLPSDLTSKLQAALDEWRSASRTEKLWARDASLWTGQDEANWLGWLDIVERQQKDLVAFRSLAADIQKAGFESALLLGMGGSSLCPEVLAVTFGRQPGFPELHILDSTDPAQVKAAEERVDLRKTVVIVASKSGSTLEPNILKQYFFERMQQAVGKENAGKHFIAVTDPGSKMEQVAMGDGFRRIFHGDPRIGGRYSALSNFGAVPAAVMGLDVSRLLTAAKRAVDACHVSDPEKNPGVLLGLTMGVAAKAGRDKITFFISPELHDLGAWAEQLIAESTGKQGKGITPVDRERIASPDHYGKDRLFTYIRLENSIDGKLDAKVDALEKAGHPVVRLTVPETYAIAGQFFYWEIATAVAGTVLGINAFNQPDVEASKIETRRLTEEYEKTGKLAEHEPLLSAGGIRLYAGAEYAGVLKAAAAKPDLESYLKAHLGQLKAGDYFAALAYVEMNAAHEAAIQEFRHRVRDAKKVATCLGFGPRFLHSTGQDYKGGPNSGVFLQITADHARDVAIPGAKYTFGVVIAAQAAGDLAVLESRGRRALRVHLGPDVEAGLKTLGAAIAAALA